MKHRQFNLEHDPGCEFCNKDCNWNRKVIFKDQEAEREKHGSYGCNDFGRKPWIASLLDQK